MKKRKDWRPRLRSFLAKHADTPFSYDPAEGMDCGAFAGGAVSAMAGINPHKQVAGQSTTREGAMQALQALGVDGAGLKWPNDVLVDGRKLGGILVDARADGAGSISVVGIGLNLRMPAGAAAAIDQPWCDLAGLGHAPPRDAVAAAVVAALLDAFALFEAEGLAPFLARWQARYALAGRAARLLEGERETAGTVLGVDARGALRFATADGERLVHSGELSLRPA